MKNSTNNFRTGLLNGAGAAALATLIATGAHAATTTIGATGTPTVTATADLSVDSPLANDGDIAASVNGAQGKIDVDGVTTGTSTVTENTIASSATGNNNQASITALTLIEDAGAAILNSSINAPSDGSAVITSSVSDSDLSIELTDFATGTAANSGNTISANATLNSAASSISGSLPDDYESATAGNATLAYPDGTPNQFSAAGTLVVATHQVAVDSGSGAGSNASVSSNDIALDLYATDNNTVTGSLALDDNAITAGFRGNSARNGVEVQAGGDPAFAGSVAVSNLQLFADAPEGDNTAAAYNDGSDIVASIDSGFTNTLAGALDVSGNSIASSATGNEALGAAPGETGNSIVLGDGMTVAGAGTANPGAGIAYDDGALDASVAADLVIFNSQGNNGLDGNQGLRSRTVEADIAAFAEAVDGGSVELSANRITSTATGNAASSSIETGTNTGGFSASLAVANQQTNYNADFGAVVSEATISATAQEGLIDGTIAAQDNAIAASAYGNQASQSTAIEANSIALGAATATLTGGNGPDGNLAANGAATVTNLQSRYDSSVAAETEDADIGVESDATDTIASSLAVSGNTQEALAVGSGATSNLSLTSGTTVGSGAGVANVQIANGSSTVFARLYESDTYVSVEGDLGVDSNGTGDSAALTGNLQRAIGYGNSADNTLNVAANAAVSPLADPADVASTVNFDPDGAAGLVFDNDGAALPEVDAAYGLLNSQTVQGSVTARAETDSLEVHVGGAAMDGSSLVNSDNDFVAAAYGNDAANAATIAVGGIDTGGAGFASVGNVTNVQTVGGLADVIAQASGPDVVNTEVEQSLRDSSLTSSDNSIQALAYGNRTTGNTLTVKATNVDTSVVDDTRGTAVASPGDDGALQLTTDASFSVQSAQSGEGSVTATQRYTDEVAQLRVSVGDNVAGSTIVADDNLSTAAATSNRAVNALAIDANGLNTTSALQNFQATSADVSASIGQAGTPGSVDEEFDYSYELILSGTCVDSTCSSVSGTDRILKSAFDADPAQLAYLLANGWDAYWTNPGTSVDDPNYISRSTVQTVPNEIDQTQWNSLNGSTFDGNATIPGEAAAHSLGGVTVAVGNNIVSSSISVSGNSTAGSVSGNSADNSQVVTATTIGGGSGFEASRAGSLGDDDFGAQADQALANVQSVQDNVLISEVYGAFAIDTDVDAVVSNTNLAIKDNSQSASAVANAASNSLRVGDEDTASVSAGSALASNQVTQGTDGGSVNATSGLEIFAPAATSNSSVVLSGNSNTSLGVVNDVTNALSVTGANVSSLSDEPANATLYGDGLATADHVLSNRQSASGNLGSTASTVLYNEDRTDTETAGLVNSSLTFAGNSTVAEASANRALNTVSVSGGATQAANAGLANLQSSSTAVTAASTMSVTLNLDGTPGDPIALIPAAPALNGSTVAVSGNVTTALARGNAATNVLNMSAGASYGPTPVDASSTSIDHAVSATAAVLNDQANSGNVTATSTNATYLVALNGAVGDPAVAGGSIAVQGNRIAAEAYGNSATNRLTVNALNTGAPTASVGNFQANSGNVTASATSVSFGFAGAGTVTGSSLHAGGNQVSATAVGNSAVTTIAAR